MPEVSGLELAERLRSGMQNLLIIFLSAHEEFVFKAIEFQPFRLMKYHREQQQMQMVALKNQMLEQSMNETEQTF